MSYNKYGTKKKQQKLVSKSGRNARKALISGFKLVLVVFIMIIVALAGAGFGMMKGVLDNAPDINTISIQPKGFKTVIYDQNGVEKNTLSTINSNRVYVYYDQIPQDMLNAFVAIEDERFWEHNGIDVRAIFRAAVRGIATKDFSQGASTITQQLIKNQVFNVGLGETTFLDKLERKIQEQYLAIELEKIYSKEEIIEYYLNTIYLGQGVHGIEAAANRYFDKSIDELTISEITTIAGITQNPYKYDPVLNPEDNAKRRKTVLEKMLELEYIDESQYETALADDVYERIAAVKTERDEKETVNSYYTDALFNALKKDFMELYGMTSAEASNEIYTGGYKIYSVQDDAIQEICDDVINNSDYYPDSTKVALSYELTLVDDNGNDINYGINSLLSYYRKETGNTKYNSIYPSEDMARAAADAFKDAMLDKTGATFKEENFSVAMQPQYSFTIMDQSTGYVKALVGGRGEKTVDRGYNRATEAKRQPGSTFKVLAAFLPYIDTGGSLASPFNDEPYTFADGTPVRNWYKSYKGPSTIRQAIANSMNIIAVKTITAVTPEVSYDYLQKLGFTTIVDERVGKDGSVYSDKTQSAALGGLTDGVTNLEITAAYAAIANGGIYTKPVYYSKVIDHDGNVVIDNTDPTKRQHSAMKATTAWMLIDAMKDVVTSGTGTAARMTSGITCAGKTGTTTSNYDLWFCGMTPYYTASIWLGYDSNTDLGSTTAHKKMWRDIMDRIAVMENQDKSADFAKPDGISSITLCKITGLLPGPGCPTCTDYCAKGTGPTERCKGHETITICLDSHMIATNTCPNTKKYVVGYDEDDNKIIQDADFQYDDSIFTSTCPLHPAMIEEYTISSSAGEGGSISQTTNVPVNSNVTFYITPNSGYAIADVIVDGVSVGAVSEYQFNDVTSNHSISVTFSGGGQAQEPAQDPTSAQ